MSGTFVLTRTWVAALLGIALFATGCIGGDSETIPPASVDDSSTDETIDDADPAGLLRSGDEGSSGATIGVEPDLLALEELWAELWSASGLVHDDRPAAIQALGTSVNPTVVELASNLLPESTLRQVHTFPVFFPSLDGSTVEVIDCAIYDPETFESTTHVHSGTAILEDGGGWLIESVGRGSSGCIPAELNAEILADYEEYWDARRTYWNPPDPDDPAIDATLTGEFRDLTRDRVGLDQQEGLRVVQDQLEVHPEIVRVLSVEQIEIRDCVEIHPGDGVFVANGERAGGVEPRGSGETDLHTTSMVLEDGQWKVSAVIVEVDNACSAPPTSAGLAIIGSP